jgi:hypothetical protein
LRYRLQAAARAAHRHADFERADSVAEGGGQVPVRRDGAFRLSGLHRRLLGRVWQIALFLGIVFWLGLMLRAIVPAFRHGGDKNLLALLCASTVTIGLFYGAGLFYGERTHITIMEYWRWWVVHL